VKVLLVTAHWPPRLSGHGDFSYKLAEALTSEGRHVEVLVLDAEPQELRPLPSGGRVEAFPFPKTLRQLIKLVRRIDAIAPDVVCLQFEANAFRLRARPHLLPLLLRARGRRVVMTYHELWAPRRAGRIAKAILLNAPNRVVTFSRWHADGVNRFRKVGAKADIIACATNIETSSTRALNRVRFGFDANTTVLTFFGFIMPSHNIETLLHVLAGLRKNGRNVMLSMIGRFDPSVDGYHQRLRDCAQELGVAGSVCWHGRVEDAGAVARLLNVTDVGMLPYDTGAGENNGAFAAMATHGLAIVTTAGERSKDMEAEGIASFVRPNHEALTEAVQHLMDDEQMRSLLAKRARSWSERRSWANCGAAYSRLLQGSREAEDLR
jgi:glycosyltransferase involved in cell wall biosynthesis